MFTADVRKSLRFIFVFLAVLVFESPTLIAFDSIDSLTKYVDALPVPRRIQADSELLISLSMTKRRLHRDLPETMEWGYQGESPGPTIEVEAGRPLTVQWKNELPPAHPLRLPKGADVISPDVRAVTHLHGADVTEDNPMDRLHNNDGWPDAWTVMGETQIAEYPNQLSARTLWYHDHAMGTTGRNVAAGLIGLYEIHDDLERKMNLPNGEFDIPLILQARGLNPDGSLFYTDDIMNEFYGNVVSVNGKIWPYLDVEPRRYRFRMLNASNARSYQLKLLDQIDMATPGPPFVQIGSDSGFLEQPVTPKRLIIAPAERMDFIVDFSSYDGRDFVLQNSSRDPGENEVEIPEIMLFRVRKKLSQPDTTSVPDRLREIVRLSPADVSQTRRIIFDQMRMPDGNMMMTLNGLGWRDAVVERPVLGTSEIWELANTLTDVHPFHIHGVQFQVLDRRLFDVEQFLKTGEVVYLGPAQPPEVNEMAWKDTVRSLPQMITRIIMRFEQHPGHFVYHCHNLEHEDMEMMRPYDIVSP